jgi:tetratricopeptide (TPR) repeat protein
VTENWAENWSDLGRDLYERAVFGGDTRALAEAEALLDAVDAALCLARGRVAHARFLQAGPEDRREDPHELELFERAAALFARLGDRAGEAESVFWVGTVHQVVRGDHVAALPALRRSADLARQAGDRLTLSYALRHLAFAAEADSDRTEARRLLEESTDLRRELGLFPGVAANLIALAFLAGDPGEAARLLDQAAEMAADAEAHGVEGWVVEARAELGL